MKDEELKMGGESDDEISFEYVEYQMFVEYFIKRWLMVSQIYGFSIQKKILGW